jgi:hypothetical protein
MKTVTVQLVTKTETGVDAVNSPTYKEDIVEVSGVLVGEPSADDVTSSVSLYGKKVKYVLAIPKGDENDWTDTEVILPAPFDGKYRTIGYPTAGIEENIPLKWNKKVMVERYG